MSDQDNASIDEQKQPTEAELKKQREDLNKFYGEQIPLLKKRAQYEGLLTEIEVARMTRFEITMARAQMMNPPQNPQGAGMKEPSSPEEAGEHMIPVNTDKKSRKLQD